MISIVPSLPETLAAVEVLSRSGVSDEAVGRAVREWLSKSPKHQAINPFDVPLPASSSPVAPAFPEPPPIAVMTPVLGPISRAVVKDTVMIKVRYPDGSVTNISLKGSLFVLLIARFGSDKAARDAARSVALAAPSSAKNRSGWVAGELSKQLASAA